MNRRKIFPDSQTPQTQPPQQVTESYDLARPTKNMRRDLRSGDAHATATALDAGVLVSATFGAPFVGTMEERYELRHRAGCPGEVEMAVTSGIKVCVCVCVKRGGGGGKEVCQCGGGWCVC